MPHALGALLYVLYVLLSVLCHLTSIICILISDIPHLLTFNSATTPLPNTSGSYISSA
jgi:hypothetical protein